MMFTSNFDPTIQTLQHKLRKQHFYSLRFPSFCEPVCRLSFLLLADTSATQCGLGVVFSGFSNTQTKASGTNNHASFK